MFIQKHKKRAKILYFFVHYDILYLSDAQGLWIEIVT